MLEAIILDNTERLLASGPYFSGMPKMRVIHAEQNVSSTTNPFAHIVASNTNACLYNDVLDHFLFMSPQSGNYIYVLDLNKWRSTTGAMVWYENSLITQQMCMEPGGTGRVWGFARNNNSGDGLWLRATGGSWSKIVGAAANDNQRMLVKPNGDLWYFNITANNWYQLQNGAAGSVQTSVPGGLNYGANQTTPADGWFNPEQFQCGYLGGLWCGSALGYSLNPLLNAYPAIGSCVIDSTSNPTGLQYNNFLNCYRAIHSSGAGGSAYGGNYTTYLNSVPEELYWACRMAVGGANSYQRWIRLNATYSLVVLSVSALSGYSGGNTINGTTWYTRNFSGEAARQKLGFVLYNKTTNNIRYLGTVAIPNQVEALSAGASELEPNDFVVLGARLVNGALDIVMSGSMGIHGTTGTTKNTGGMWMQIPLNKLDF